MIRRLLWLLGLLGAWLLLRRVVGRPRSGASGTTVSPRFEGAMVRDRICETFVPKALALRLHQGDQEHFFCSEDCRATFLSRQRLAQ